MRWSWGRGRIGAGGGFVLLCILLGSRWLIEGGLPETASSYVSQAIGYVLAAGALGAFTLRQKRQLVAIAHTRLTVKVLAGMLVLCGPALGAAIAGRSLGSGNGTLALALVPVVIAVVGASLPGAEQGEMIGHLWPGLAGLAGLLLLLPEPSLGSARVWIGLATIPMLTGWGVAYFAGSQRTLHGVHDTGPSWAGSLSCLAAATVMAVIALRNSSFHTASHWPVQAAGLDAAVAVSMLLLLGYESAYRFSALYLLVPLVTLIEGVVFLRPVLDLRSWVGFALLLVSGARLLFGAEAQETPELTLSVHKAVPRA